jgi:hypothetical protein
MSNYIKVLPAVSTPIGATLMKTGQTTSYRTGDDGDLEVGRATDFFTLPSNNPFGNTNRFTAPNGSQTYTDLVVIDWSTYDNVAETVLGWYLNFYDDAANWNEAIDKSLLKSIGGFTSGWFLPNTTELFSIINYGITATGTLNYAPWSYAGTQFNLFTSTTVPLTTTQCYILTLTNGTLGSIVKTSGGPRYKPCRVFTVTGTTLT